MFLLDLPVPPKFRSLIPATTDTPSSVPTETPAFKVPVCFSSTLISTSTKLLESIFFSLTSTD